MNGLTPNDSMNLKRIRMYFGENNKLKEEQNKILKEIKDLLIPIRDGALRKIEAR